MRHHQLSFGLLVLLCIVGFNESALADRGVVHLRDGSAIAGELVSYEPGVQIVLRLATEQEITIAQAEIARVEIGVAEVTPSSTEETLAERGPDVAPERSADLVPPPPMGPPQGPMVQAYGYRPYTQGEPPPRREPPSMVGRPRMGMPFYLLMAGVTLTIGLGVPLFITGYDSFGSSDFSGQEIAGMTFMTMGGILSVLSMSLALPMRLRKRRAWYRANGIATLQVAPMVSRDVGGLQMHMSF